MVCSTLFIKIHKVLKVNIWRMFKCNLLKLSFVWNFHNEIVCWIFCNSEINCVIKTREIFNFLPLINNPATIELSFLLLSKLNNWYFSSFVWIVLFNIFIDIIHINQIFNKSFWIIKVVNFVIPLHILFCQFVIDILPQIDL